MNSLAGRQMFIKRLFDLVMAAAGLTLAMPLILSCLLAVRATSPGPGIFKQVRVGKDGAPFVCWKLRTMFQNTGDVPSHHVRASAVTPLGRLLRRTKLDELPQLWNVLKGEMSFVGPRPCLPTQHELIEARRRRGVDQLRPGITGVAQVVGIDMSDPEQLAALDATYFDDMSFRRDMQLIFATLLGAGRGDRVAQNDESKSV